MRMTYLQALAEVLEVTELGYTQKSQDRLWTACIYDEFSTDQFRHNRLYFCEGERGMSYDVMDDTLFWTRRHEAEVFAREQQAIFDQRRAEEPSRPDIKVYVFNYGDGRRWERAYFGELEQRYLYRGKFAGSDAAMAEQTRQFNLAVKHHAALEAAKAADKEKMT